jgi:hypothetical protein
MIPTFPKFAKLNISFKDEINKRTLKHLPYCDYNFVALWSYNLQNKIEVSILNNNLVVKLVDCITDMPFFSFFGSNKFEQTSIVLLQYSTKKNIYPQLKVIPEDFIDINHTYSSILIKEDRHNFDYIFLLEDISKLRGKKFRIKRNLLNKFNRMQAQHTVSILDLTDTSTKKEILNVFAYWERVKKKSKTETKNELEALAKLLDYAREFNLLSIGIYLNNKLEAFTICEVVHKNYAIGHFAKANFHHKGIYEALYKSTADYLMSKGCKYLNMEQDMGEENLRYAKTLWHPAFFLKKYSIVLAKPIS